MLKKSFVPSTLAILPPFAPIRAYIAFKKEKRVGKYMEPLHSFKPTFIATPCLPPSLFTRNLTAFFGIILVTVQVLR
jgi:hypothetical protein